MSNVKHFVFASCYFSDELTLEKFNLLKEYLVDVIELNSTLHPSYPFFVEIHKNEIRVGCDIEREFAIYNTMSKKTLVKIFRYIVNKIREKCIVDLAPIVEHQKYYEKDINDVFWQYKNGLKVTIDKLLGYYGNCYSIQVYGNVKECYDNIVKFFEQKYGTNVFDILLYDKGCFFWIVKYNKKNDDLSDYINDSFNLQSLCKLYDLEIEITKDTSCFANVDDNTYWEYYFIDKTHIEHKDARGEENPFDFKKKLIGEYIEV